jgi:chemotaxis protein MotB
MNKLRQRRHSIEEENVDRWLVSYADYMTLLFALFVVLYAMAIVNDKPIESVTESLGRVFQAEDELTKNKGQGDDLLPVNTITHKKNLYGNGILEVAGPDLVDSEKDLSNIEDSVIGTNLESLENKLHTALYELVESGYAELQVDGDWLEIELSSGLLFPSGSSSPTNEAVTILTLISDVIGDVSNFVRIRGYTDNQAIENEIFASNWELSVVRATAVLRELEVQKINPARMAIEGYGQYYPSADNATAAGRSQNRRVVIAISKYGLQNADLLKTPTISVKDVEEIKKTVASTEQPNKIKIIRLENGGIRITTRDDNTLPPQ